MNDKNDNDNCIKTVVMQADGTEVIENVPTMRLESIKFGNDRENPTHKKIKAVRKKT